MEQKPKEMEKKEKKKLTGKQKYDMVTETAFGCLQVVALVFLFFVIKNLINWRKELIKLNPSYPFPQLKDLYKSIIILLPILAFKGTLESFFVHIVPKLLKENYKHPTNEKDKQEAEILPPKIARHFYKIAVYTGMSIYAFIVLKDLDYFPKSLLGHGEMKNMFKAGYPNAYYRERSSAFDYLYLISLSFALSDCFSLISTYGTQNDFKNMLLHHTCEVSLIIFSYLTNYSNIGSLVLFTHNISDIPNHLTKIFLRTEVPQIVTTISGVFFILGFLYFRMYVFGEVIYTGWFYVSWKWTSIEWALEIFMVFLYIMNTNWTFILLFKFVKLMLHGEVQDNVQYVLKTGDSKDKSKEKKKN